jgi:UDP-glucose 4-epimerase
MSAGVDTSSYRDRPVLVAGGLGYIGLHVTERLRALGAQVTVVTRSLVSHRDTAARLAIENIRIVEADVRDAAAMRAAVTGQDVVFNLAGRSGAVDSMEDPWTDLDVNCRGNLVLLEAMRTSNPQGKIVFVSSRLTYGAGGDAPIDENHQPDPLSVHGVHKLAAEQYLRVYARAHGLRFAIARLTNPYGPGQPAGRTAYGVVNRLIHQALAGKTLSIYGDGAQKRDYIYIDDAVAALLTLGATGDSDGRLYNVGSGVGTPLVEMARAIVRIAGSGTIEFVEWPKLAALVETGDFVASIDRIKRELDWAPRVSLDEGLKRTTAAYRAHVA